MKIRRLLAGALALAFAVSAAGCSAPSSSAAPASEPTAAPATPAPETAETAEETEPASGTALRLAGLQGPTSMGLVNLVEASAVLHDGRRHADGRNRRLGDRKLRFSDSRTAGRTADINLITLLIRDHRVIPVHIGDRRSHLIADGPYIIAGSVKIRRSVLGITDHIFAKGNILDKLASRPRGLH